MKPTSIATELNRRSALKTLLTTTAVAAFAPAHISRAAEPQLYVARSERIKQSVAPWCFRPMPIDELAAHSVKMGIRSIELIGPDQFEVVKKHKLTSAMVSSHGFARGFARPEQHAECLQVLRERIDLAAAAGFPNVITFSGFRKGLSDEEGTRNMVDGLKQIVGHAEKKGVTLCLEMLNSKVAIEMKGHPDYFCDNIDKSVDICRAVGSERLKVLFDIYHVQIMHGDVISRIRQHFDWIGHIHTAGNPGRNEIDRSQEINYRPIMQALVDLGYKGYVGQEFIPLKDKVQSLNDAVRICDV